MALRNLIDQISQSYGPHIGLVCFVLIVVIGMLIVLAGILMIIGGCMRLSSWLEKREMRMRKPLEYRHNRIYGRDFTPPERP
jgi:hypothetical protein